MRHYGNQTCHVYRIIVDNADENKKKVIFEVNILNDTYSKKHTHTYMCMLFTISIIVLYY